MNQVVRQTRTHIGELLSRHGLRPRHDLGQNFLIDLNLLEFLVAQAEIGPNDLVLEVGSGTGSLTRKVAGNTAPLAPRTSTVISRFAVVASRGKSSTHQVPKSAPGGKSSSKRSGSTSFW